MSTKTRLSQILQGARSAVFVGFILGSAALVAAETPYPEEPREEPCEQPGSTQGEPQEAPGSGVRMPGQGDGGDGADHNRFDHLRHAGDARERASRLAQDGLYHPGGLPNGGMLHPERPGIDLGGQIDRLSVLIEDSTIACATCIEGQIIYASQGRSTSKFNILDGEMSVKVKSASNGGYGIPGAENALDFKAPVSPTPIGIYNAIVRAVGSRALKAGKRIGDRNAAQLLDIEISVPLKPVTVICAPATKCINGQFVDIGVVEMSRTFGKPFTRKKRYEAVGPKEMKRLGQKVVNGCNLRDAGYQPCGGGGKGGAGGGSGGSGGGTAPGGGGGTKSTTPPAPSGQKSCDPIRKELADARAALGQAKGDLARLEAEQKRLEGVYKDKKAAWEAKLDAALRKHGKLARDYEQAGRDMDQAIEMMKQAANATARARITARFKRAQARKDALAKPLADAKAEVQRAAKPPAELDRITDQIGEVIGRQVEKLGEILKLLERIKALEAQLSACVASGGK